MQVFIYCIITLHVSDVYRTHHQQTDDGCDRATTFLGHGHLGHVGGRLLLRYCDLYQRMQLQFYVLLMMGAKDTQNM